MPERVLVTGAAGFVGLWTLEPLAAAGLEVHAVSRRTADQARQAGAAVGAGSGDAQWHRVDLLEPEAAARLIEVVRPHYLLHLAWYTKHGAYWTALENVRWVEASLALLRAFAEAGGRRAAVAGTCAEYAWTAGMPLREYATPIVPATLYGAAKHGLHTVASAASTSWEISLVWPRLFGLFGPGEEPQRLVASLATALLAGREARTSAGDQERDLLYVADAGEALATLLSSDVEGPVNLASGVGTTLRQVAQSLGQAAGRVDLVRAGELASRPGEPPRLEADVERLQLQVGWAPKTPLADALGETLEWWRGHLAEVDGGG